jgi:hypothetical protein
MIRTSDLRGKYLFDSKQDKEKKRRLTSYKKEARATIYYVLLHLRRVSSTSSFSLLPFYYYPRIY